MIPVHSSTAKQRAEWVSTLLAQEGSYGVVSQMSRTIHVSRQTLYSWKAKGQTALEQTFTPLPGEQKQKRTCELERAVLTLLVEGHASYRGIQSCLERLLGEQVSLGTIVGIVQRAGERAQQWLSEHAPLTQRALALDELYSSQRGEAYLSVVDVQSAAVWTSTSPVAVDGESWTLLLWEMQEQGLHWHTTVSDGGRAIQEAVQTVAPEQVHQRDVWHVLHECQKVQGRLDRLVEHLEQQAPTVARQAVRIAEGQRPRGAHPVSDVQAHTALLQQAHYAASALRYVSGELRRLLEVVVLHAQPQAGLLSSQQRWEELEVLLSLFEEVWHVAPEELPRTLKSLWHHLQLALPHLVTFADGLESVHQQVSQQLGAAAVHVIAWAWQRRAILGPRLKQLIGDFPPEWQPSVALLMQVWNRAVRASSAVENWHSVLRPYLAVHRTLSSGLLAILAVWHNHRVASRGLHQGQSPLQRSGLTDVSSDWLLVVGYPSPTTAAGMLSLPAVEEEAALAA
jgi:transposase-like protein